MKAEWTGLGEVLDGMERIRKRAAQPRQFMRRVSELGRSSTIRRIETGRFAANAAATVAAKGSSKPLRDRGRYVQSLGVKWTDSYAAWGSNLPQARILNDGGTVKPKRAKFLTFPVNRDGRRAVRRYGSPRAAIKGLRATGVRVWFVVKPGAESGAVLMQRTKRSRVVVLFVLKSSVVIPPRRHYYVDDADGADIQALARDWFAGDMLPAARTGRRRR